MCHELALALSSLTLLEGLFTVGTDVNGLQTSWILGIQTISKIFGKGLLRVLKTGK